MVPEVAGDRPDPDRRWMIILPRLIRRRAGPQDTVLAGRTAVPYSSGRREPGWAFSAARR
jgi:hypothetical protein